MQLDRETAAAGVRLLARETVGSTNAEALSLARAGETGPLWITARRQSAGRGRRGRVWVSEAGNLYASLLLTNPSPRERAAELSFVAAVAVYHAVAGLAPASAGRLAFKWPNDLLIDGKKFCGILIEGEGPAVVIGIGINCGHHPSDASYPATDLSAAGVPIVVEKLFEKLSGTMMRRLAHWQRGEAFASIRAEWLAHAAGLGGPLRVQTPDGDRRGQFEAIDESGRLILRLPSGACETITAGDVFEFAPDRARATATER
jgi:BirA family transcriptional regulator, biotin operon repressor / biotin---[acetyl-CoA-carboxylase] ligase